jgi:hypothetical protein
MISDPNIRLCISLIPHSALASASRDDNVHAAEFTIYCYCWSFTSSFMVLLKNCRWGEKCFISVVYTVVTDGRGIVVSVVWFSRGLLCEAGREDVKYLATQGSSVAFSKQ